jgi:hypothetical protein
MSPKASEMDPTAKVSMLLKSPFGFGKTIAACSAAVEGPIWLSYWDKKAPIELLTYFKKHRPDILDNITWEAFGAWNAHEYLNRLFSFTKDCRYVALVNDSVTFMTSSAVNWSMGFREKGGKSDKVNKDAHVMIPDFDEYKVETGLVTQAMDICRSLPCHIIWTAHPLPAIKVEGSGAAIKVTKVNNIVSYGQKVGAIVPGGFTEVYHLSRSIDYSQNPSVEKRIVLTDMIGDDFAKTSLGLPKELDITNKLFWEVWRDAVKKANNTEVTNEVKESLTQSQQSQWKV